MPGHCTRDDYKILKEKPTPRATRMDMSICTQDQNENLNVDWHMGISLYDDLPVNGARPEGPSDSNGRSRPPKAGRPLSTVPVTPVPCWADSADWLYLVQSVPDSANTNTNTTCVCHFVSPPYIVCVSVRLCFSVYWLSRDVPAIKESAHGDRRRQPHCGLRLLLLPT